MSVAAGYICDDAGLFENLADYAWFRDFVIHQYVDVFFGYGPYLPHLSDYQLSEAHNHWVKDTSRVSTNEYSGGPLDHFKRAALLCYWLRRCPPIFEFVRNIDYSLASVRLRSDPKEKLRFANQAAAFDLGFRICRFWEAARADSARDYRRDLKPHEITLQAYPSFSHDVAYVLAEKNMSPHAIALIYRALFVDPLQAAS